MAEMEVSPQEEMANLQGMKVFAVERPGLSRSTIGGVGDVANSSPF